MINKPLTLLGAQAGQDANVRFAAFVSGPNGPKASGSVESIITAPSVDTANNDLVRIISDHVTVDGFVVDGNNPSLGTSGALKINDAGPYVDARNGIDTLDPATGGQAVNGLLIENNIVQNVAHDGISAHQSVQHVGRFIREPGYRERRRQFLGLRRPAGL